MLKIAANNLNKENAISDRVITLNSFASLKHCLQLNAPENRDICLFITPLSSFKLTA
jgi:hypothetical protein